METKRRPGRPQVAEHVAKVQAYVDAKVARRLKILAVELGVLPTAVYRAAFDEYLARHEAQAVQN